MNHWNLLKKYWNSLKISDICKWKFLLDALFSSSFITLVFINYLVKPKIEICILKNELKKQTKHGEYINWYMRVKYQ